jgi:hypothetical protein
MKRQGERESPGGENVNRNYAIKGVISLAVVFIVFLSALLFFPKLFLYRYAQKQIVKAFQEAVPGYSIKLAGTQVNLWKSSIGCDSVTIQSLDSLLILSAKHMSVAGIKWAKLLGNRHSGEKAFTRSVANIESFSMTFRKTAYQLSCDRLHFSVPDSIIAFDSFTFCPVVKDEPFFALSTYRKTRYSIHIPKVRIHWSAQLDQWKKSIYRIHFVQLQQPSFDFLVNRDKPIPPRIKKNLMPNQMLNSIDGKLQIDSLQLEDGKLEYKERFAVKAKPSMISINHIHLEGKQIKNHCLPEDTAYFNAHADFMEGSKMKINLLFMPGAPQFSLIYGGSLGPMEINQLNRYLIIGEHKKIKTGTLQEAVFKIHLLDVQSSGTVRAFYKDLKLAAVDTSGDEGGILKKAGSLLSNIKIRNNNTLADEKKGEVRYVRKPENTFIQFMWFSLREGTKEILGL